MTVAPARFRDRSITFANGSVGQALDIPSANPVNYHQAVSRPAEMPRMTIDGQLFLPPAGASTAAPLPLVIVTPGSLGVAPSHVAHAEALTGVGIAAFVLDPFGARGIGSTVANQTQYSFAASAYDVLAALGFGKPFTKIYIDVSGLSGYRSLLDLIALLNMYATVLQPEAIVVKSGALKQFAGQCIAWQSPVTFAS